MLLYDRANLPPLVHPPITTIALSLTTPIATSDLGDDRDAAAIFHQRLSESSYILISEVDLSFKSRPPTITGGDELGTSLEHLCETSGSAIHCHQTGVLLAMV